MPARNWILWARRPVFFVLFLLPEKEQNNILLPILFKTKKWRWGDSHPRPNILSSQALQV